LSLPLSSFRPNYLGRWKIENEYRTNLKADYANDDHCGVCSSFTQKNKDQHLDKDVDKDKYEDDYSIFLIEYTQDDPTLKNLK
jgi:hypothetical protein